MDSGLSSVWITACAHRFQARWRRVDSDQLEELAGDLWRDESLRSLDPKDAAKRWLKPLANGTTDAP